MEWDGDLLTLSWKSSDPQTIQFLRATKRPADSVRRYLYTLLRYILLTSHRDICELEGLDNRLI